MADCEKWAIVGFVGYGALDQLPDQVAGLNVVCWPKAGATNPDGVRRLLSAGVHVYFCNRLHTKLYWAKDRGVIVGSANLSQNALSNSGQHEFAVYLEDKSFDVASVLARLSYNKVTESSLGALDQAYVAAKYKDPDSDEASRKPLSFLDSRNVPFPKKWKLAIWSVRRTDNEPIKEEVFAETGASRWVNDNDVEANQFEVGDFVLQVHVGGGELVNRANGKWLRVELVTKSKSAPAIVQLTQIADGPPPPFEIDPQFIRGFRALYNECEWDEIIDEKATVKEEFILRIQALYKDS